MRAALLLSTICLLGFGCAAGPPPAPVAAAPEPASERWPTAQEAAEWTISRDEAIGIARDALEDQDPRHMIYRAYPFVRGGEAFWRVTGASMIAGGWKAEIDARTGTILRLHHLRGR